MALAAGVAATAGAQASWEAGAEERVAREELAAERGELAGKEEEVVVVTVVVGAPQKEETRPQQES